MNFNESLNLKDKINLGRQEITDPMFIDYLTSKYGNSGQDVINWIQVSGKTQEITPANLNRFILIYTKEQEINVNTIGQLLTLSSQFTQDFENFIKANQSNSVNEMIKYMIHSHAEKIHDIKHVETEFSKLLVDAQIEKISSNPFSKKDNYLVGIEKLSNEKRNLNIRKTLDTILKETPRNDFKMN
jgi:lysyl-tRNA synthetase class I